MAFVTINEADKITGEFARPQDGMPGYCEISDDDPRYMEWVDVNAKRSSIFAEIAALEALQTPRRVREAMLGVDGGWLDNLNGQIAELRSSL